MRDVVGGEVAVLRSKKPPASNRRQQGAGAPLLQRFTFDTGLMLILTDAPASDFVIA